MGSNRLGTAPSAYLRSAAHQPVWWHSWGAEPFALAREADRPVLLDIDLNVRMGSLTLIVPAGTQVENESEEKFSSTSHSTRSTQGMRRIGLLIRITGRVHWSSLEIKEKPPSGMEPKPRWMRLLAGE